MSHQIFQTAILGATMRRRRAVSADYQATVADNVIFVDASSGPVNVTLPASTRAQYTPQNAGTELTIQRVDATANAVTVLPSGGDTIAGGVSLSLAAGEATTLINAGAGAWWPVASGGGGGGSGAESWLLTSQDNASSGLRYVPFFDPAEGTTLNSTTQIMAPVDWTIDRVQCRRQQNAAPGPLCTLEFFRIAAGGYSPVSQGTVVFTATLDAFVETPIGSPISIPAGDELAVAATWSVAPGVVFLNFRVGT